MRLGSQFAFRPRISWVRGGQGGSGLILRRDRAGRTEAGRPGSTPTAAGKGLSRDYDVYAAP